MAEMGGEGKFNRGPQRPDKSMDKEADMDKIWNEVCAGADMLENELKDRKADSASIAMYRERFLNTQMMIRVHEAGYRTIKDAVEASVHGYDRLHGKPDKAE